MSMRVGAAGPMGPSERAGNAKQVPSEGKRLSALSRFKYVIMTGLFYGLATYSKDKVTIANAMAKDVSELKKIMKELESLSKEEMQTLKDGLQDESVRKAIRNGTPEQKYAIIKNPTLISTLLMPRAEKGGTILPSGFKGEPTAGIMNKMMEIAGNKPNFIAREIMPRLSLMSQEQLTAFAKLVETNDNPGAVYLSQLIEGKFTTEETAAGLNSLMLSSPEKIEKFAEGVVRSKGQFEEEAQYVHEERQVPAEYLTNENIRNAVQNATPEQRYVLASHPTLISSLLMPRVQKGETVLLPSELAEVKVASIMRMPMMQALSGNHPALVQKEILPRLTLMNDAQLHAFLKLIENADSPATLYLDALLASNLPSEEIQMRLNTLMLSSPENMATLGKVFNTRQDLITLLGNRLDENQKFLCMDQLVQLGVDVDNKTFTQNYANYFKFLEGIKNRQQDKPRRITSEDLIKRFYAEATQLQSFYPTAAALLDSSFSPHEQIIEFGVAGFVDAENPDNVPYLKTRRTVSPEMEGAVLANEIHHTKRTLEVYITDPRTMESTCVRRLMPLPIGLDEEKREEYIRFLKECCNTTNDAQGFAKAIQQYQSSALRDGRPNPLSEEEMNGEWTDVKGVKHTIKTDFQEFARQFHIDIAKAKVDFNETLPTQNNPAIIPRRGLVLQREAFVEFLKDPNNQETAITACKERAIFKLDNGKLSLLPVPTEIGTFSPEDIQKARAAFVKEEMSFCTIPLLGPDGRIIFDVDETTVGNTRYLALNTTMRSHDSASINRLTFYPMLEGESLQAAKERLVNSDHFERDLLLARADCLEEATRY